MSDLSTVLSDNRLYHSPHRKKLIWALVLLLVVCAAYFWGASRYPDLNEKALTGGDTNIGAIGFDVIFELTGNEPLWQQAVGTSINWMYTNWRGMAFGLVFGTLVMSILPLLGDFRITNGFANAVKGLFIGTPLGVCANCAAPIAKGMLISGARTETALAALLSSPSLNVIVISIAVALLPFHFVLLKLAATFVSILIIVPIVCRLAPFDFKQQTVEQLADNIRVEADPFLGNKSDQAKGFFSTLVTLISKNAWLLVIKTVPLMILAGFLGGFVVTLLPFANLPDLLPGPSGMKYIVALGLLACLGLFLPVPMAFDVILTAVLLQAGLHPAYAMVLFLTLGTFSFYPYMLMTANGGGRTASFLSVSLLLIAVSGGIAAHIYNRHLEKAQVQARIDILNERAEPFPHEKLSYRQPGVDAETIAEQVSNYERKWQPFEVVGNLVIEARPFEPASLQRDDAALNFKKHTGQTIGFREPMNYIPQNVMIRNAEGRAIASGDINNDGWTDVIFSSHDGIGVYINAGGQKFIKQDIDLALLPRTRVFNVSLVDLNNDGKLDLFYTTDGSGSYVAYNSFGNFEKSNLVQLPNLHEDSVAYSAGFADLDQNGELDIFLGNIGRHNPRTQSSYKLSRNAVLFQENGRFTVSKLPEVPGETLAVLIHDFNDDGLVDLFAGNDFEPADEVFQNLGNREFVVRDRRNPIIPQAGTSTMSLVAADIDNDLVPEVYLAQKTLDAEFLERNAQTFCEGVEQAQHLTSCEAVRELIVAVRFAQREADIRLCDTIQNDSFRHACFGYALRNQALRNSNQKRCEEIGSAWPELARDCNHFFDQIEPVEESRLADALPSLLRKNLLYKKNPDDEYKDVALELGVDQAGWSWNAKFSDLDNDGWQDLFVASGDATALRFTPDFLYQNKQGSKFENITDAAGLLNRGSNLGYSYLDFDNDGDLDIVMLPQFGEPYLYENLIEQNQSIVFRLQDEIGNHDGVGARIIVQTNRTKQIREIKASGGYLSFDPMHAHFGLGKNTTIDGIRIIWPSGESQDIRGPFAAGYEYQITRKPL